MNQPNGQPAQPAGQTVTSAIPNGALPLPIPGVTIASRNDNPAPMLLVTGREKQGKSTTVITSLYDWPSPGMKPLVLAFDPTGSDACLRLGFTPHRMRITDMAGVEPQDRMRSMLRTLEQNKQALHANYGSLVVDCASTATEQLHAGAKRLPKNANNPNTMAPFFEMGLWLKELIRGVRDLGLPSVWLAWQLEQTSAETKDERTGQKKFRTIEGGADIMGTKARNHFTGVVEHIFTLERQKHSVDAPGADQDGFVRLFHSQPWNGVNAGGRYSHLLPEPCPPHMGWILSQITGRGSFVQAQQQTQVTK